MSKTLLQHLFASNISVRLKIASIATAISPTCGIAVAKMILKKGPHLNRLKQYSRSRLKPAYQIIDEQPSPSPTDCSVIIPLYNYESYITEAIQSISLSKSTIDIIVVDDESTDNSLQTAQKALQDSALPFKLIKNTPNRGLCATRNLALNLSDSTYVFTLDADDLIDAKTFDQELCIVKSNQPSAHYNTVQLVDEFGKPTGKVLSCDDWNPHRLRQKNYICASAFFKRKTLLNIGGYNTELLLLGTGSEDWELWLRFAHFNEHVSNGQSTIVSYRQKPGSMVTENHQHGNHRRIRNYLAHRDLL